jgi:hypothetical protein
MKNYLYFFSIKTGVFLNGFLLIADLIGQFSFMYNAGSFFWFEYNYPIFDFIKTIVNIFYFLALLKENTQISRYNYYIISLINMMATGVYSPLVWYWLKNDSTNPKYDKATMNLFVVVFIFGFLYQIYVVLINKTYYEEDLIKEEEKIN